jgi:hypothetical protein
MHFDTGEFVEESQFWLKLDSNRHLTWRHLCAFLHASWAELIKCDIYHRVKRSYPCT